MRRGAAPDGRVSLPFLLFLLVGALALALLARPRLVERDDTRLLMDTFVTVRVRAAGAREAEAALRAAFAEMERAARALDWFDSTRVAGRELPVGEGVVEPDLARVLGTGLEVARLSGGAFDPTVRPLTALWRFEDTPRVPSDEEIREARQHVGWRHVRVAGERVAADTAGIRLDLGAVGKGYVVDEAIEVLRARHGVRAALVAASGDMRAFGPGPRRGEWTIGLAHPRAPGALAARFPLSDGAVSTSGDYERAFFEGGVRYHHLLDARTGWPARGAASATVFAPTATEADALATACFVLGPEEGRRLLEGLPGREAIWIVERGGALAAETTRGLAGRVAVSLDAPAGAAR